MTTIIDRTITNTQVEKKPIELHSYIGTSGGISNAETKPTEFSELILLEKDYDTYDLILGIHATGAKSLYFGHWNSGNLK